MAFLAALVILALAVFGGRLVYVQGLRGASIAEQARDARLTSITLLGGRGEITDAEGAPLATSVERYEISVNQRLVAKFTGSENPPVPDGAAGVAATLAPLLDMNAAELGGALVGDRQFVYIRKGVLPEVAREVRKLGLSGVNVDRVAERVYPNSTLAGNVVGFVNSNGVGLAGPRGVARRPPHGHGRERDLRARAQGAGRSPAGTREDTPATQGDSVQLTLLSDVQWKAQSALDAQVAATGSSSGSLIVMDIRTGEIYALADSGSVDPNHPGEASGSLSSAVSDVFEPGSTGKVITMAAILDNKIADPLSQWEVPVHVLARRQGDVQGLARARRPAAHDDRACWRSPPTPARS